MAKKGCSKRRIMLLFMAFWVFTLPLAAQKARVSGETNLVAARIEIEQFGAMLSNVVSASFNSSPFALVQKPKGAYLQGYGVAFQFVVNIHRAVLNTPFGQMRRGNEITPEAKKRLIDDLKEKLIQTLSDNGASLVQLKGEDTVSIVAFIEDQKIPDEPNENKVITISVLKKDLDELAGKADRINEFKQRIKIIEY
ncbi:MAG: hypothetical protein H6Q04_374 [Acidobacteria bacterium]|jgi:hypothetical protein|nr:hypothetical protein [Acidobacteriota bacterium]